MVGVVPRVFGFEAPNDTGGDVGFGKLVAFEVVRVSRYSNFRFLPPFVCLPTFCLPASTGGTMGGPGDGAFHVSA